jgi:hypothetical protein
MDLERFYGCHSELDKKYFDTLVYTIKQKLPQRPSPRAPL